MSFQLNTLFLLVRLYNIFYITSAHVLTFTTDHSIRTCKLFVQSVRTVKLAPQTVIFLRPG